MLTMPICRFDLEAQLQANDEWGANCGPGALAAVLDLTLNEVRPFLGEFEQKRYMNPTMVYEALRRSGVPWRLTKKYDWPSYGLARIQWGGPWMQTGVPIGARYGRTHWVGVRATDNGIMIFDINAMSVGGWIPVGEWAFDLVPWLLRELHPKADGRWYVTHSIEVQQPAGESE